MMHRADVHHQHAGGRSTVPEVYAVDIDEQALAEAMRFSGAATKQDAVNLALREFVARHSRAAALSHYAALATEWDFDGWKQRRAAEKHAAP